MSYSLGTTYKTTLFGQSHAPAIGCVIDGIPCGTTIDFTALNKFLSRRAPGNTPGATSRKESDTPQILSGLNEDNVCCGTPLCAVIYNKDHRSGDYKDIKYTPRPSHSDYPAYVKYAGNNDTRGGGAFSGRLTAALCISGGIAKQILKGTYNIDIAAHIKTISNISDDSFLAYDTKHTSQIKLMSQIQELEDKDLPVLNQDTATRMQDYIKQVSENKDSCGALVECVACGIKPGIGNPRFRGIDSQLASALLSIPSVKGFEIGSGMDVASMLGSENNDEYTIDNGCVIPTTNNAGGVIGGITTGAPIVFKVAIKPTPSIGITQNTVNLQDLTQTTISVKGRHDSCIAIRVVPVIEAVCAMVLLDAILSN